MRVHHLAPAARMEYPTGNEGKTREKIQEKMMQVGAANKGLKRQIGQWAKRTGLVWNQNLLNGMETSMTSGLKYKIADKVVFQVIVF